MAAPHAEATAGQQTGARLPPRAAGLAALALALAFGLQGWLALPEISLTWDEPLYIASGHSYLRTGDFRMLPEAPPLMQELAGLSLLAVGAPPVDTSWQTWQEARPIGFARRTIFYQGLDLQRVALLARLPALLLGTALVLAIYAWGRGLLGEGPALLAAALAALSPNLLAHAELATLDLGVTAFGFAAVFAFWRACRSGAWTDWALCGLATGAAVASKFSALLLGPIFAALALAWGVQRRGEVRPARLLAGMALGAAAAWVTIGLCYGGLFDGSLLLAGVRTIYTRMTPDYRFYLLGEVSTEPWWYYSLVTLALKLPVPTLALLGLAAVAAVRARSGEAALFLLLPAGAFLVAGALNPYNIGLRHVLPALPFLLLFAGHALAGRPGRLRVALAVGLLAWAALEAARIHPHHLAYFNQLAGGPERGPYLLDDSNLDWGQDLPALARWQRENLPDEPLHLLYFGFSEPAAYGVRAVPMTPEEIERPGPGVYAVSVHNLVWFRKLAAERGADLDWLARYEPMARAGHSIWIYRFP